MTDLPQLPPMGWYPDPADPANERYWDGTSWTHNTKPAEPTAWPGAAATQHPVAVQPQAPQQQPYSSQQYPQQPYSSQQYPQQPFPSQQYAPQQYPPQQHPYAAQPGVHQGYGQVAMTTDGVPLAGWWLRVGAHILDMILVGAVSLALGWPYVRRILDAYQLFMADYIAASQAMARGEAASIPVLTSYDIVNPTSGFQLVQVVVLLAYLVLCFGLLSGTLFQRAFGMRVVPTGQGNAPRLGWGQSVTRALLFSLVTMVPFLPYLSYLMPLWTSKKQTLHDMVAGTQVVKRR